MLFFLDCVDVESWTFCRGESRKVRRLSGIGVSSAGGVRFTFWRNTGSDTHRVYKVQVNANVNED